MRRHQSFHLVRKEQHRGHKPKRNFRVYKRTVKVQKQGYKKSRRLCNRHHLVNKCKGGKATLRNLLIINIYRHRALHSLFQNKSLDQIISYLERQIDCEIIYDSSWIILFRNLSLNEAIELLIRVKRAKENQTI